MNTYEKILFSIGGAFSLFCMVNMLFGENTAIWLARGVTMAVLMALASYGVILFMSRIRLSMAVTGRDVKKESITIKRLETELERLRMETQVSVHRLHGPGLALAVDHTGKSPRISSYGYHPEPQRLYNPLPEPGLVNNENNLPSIMPFIKEALSLFIVGPQGTGKTTLLQHIIDSRKGEAIILDPHDHQGKYPAKARVIGFGRNYEAINGAMNDIISELRQRYETYQGQDYPPLWVYIDELTLLHHYCSVFKQFMEVMLTESRKVGIKLTICSHSKRVRYIGLQGALDLADGVIKIFLKNAHGERWAEVELPDGDIIECSLPGPYRPKEQIQTHSKPCLTVKSPEYGQMREPDFSRVPEKKPRPVMTKQEKKVFDYIRKRGGQVKRGQMIMSKCLGKKAKAVEYSDCLDSLIKNGLVDVKIKKRQTDWVYTVK